MLSNSEVEATSEISYFRKQTPFFNSPRPTSHVPDSAHTMVDKPSPFSNNTGTKLAGGIFRADELLKLLLNTFGGCPRLFSNTF